MRRGRAGHPRGLHDGSGIEGWWSSSTVSQAAPATAPGDRGSHRPKAFTKHRGARAGLGAAPYCDRASGSGKSPATPKTLTAVAKTGQTVIPGRVSLCGRRTAASAGTVEFPTGHDRLSRSHRPPARCSHPRRGGADGRGSRRRSPAGNPSGSPRGTPPARALDPPRSPRRRETPRRSTPAHRSHRGQRATAPTVTARPRPQLQRTHARLGAPAPPPARPGP